MQASKIKTGTVYAIESDTGLARYRIMAVVTRRVNDYGNPHDYESHVEGYVMEDATRQLVKVKPEKVLGLYQDHVELVERERLEKEAQARKELEAEQLRDRVLVALYAKTGMTPPDDGNRRNGSFQTNYGGGIVIHAKAFTALLACLERAPDFEEV